MFISQFNKLSGSLRNNKNSFNCVYGECSLRACKYVGKRLKKKEIGHLSRHLVVEIGIMYCCAISSKVPNGKRHVLFYLSRFR